VSVGNSQDEEYRDYRWAVYEIYQYVEFCEFLVSEAVEFLRLRSYCLEDV